MNCPICNATGKHVDTQTVKGVLSATLEILKPGNPYYYCKTLDCETVYFHEDGSQVISEEGLRVPVYHKHANAPSTKICYCFEILIQDLEEDIAAFEGKKSVGRINAGITAGQCACDIRNPEGVCCLGNVKRHIKTALA